MNKKYLSLILALVMIVSTFSIANATPTNNVKVDWLVDKGIVKGDASTGELRLNDTITRAEAAAMIVRVQELETSAEDFNSLESQFKDIKTTYWANGYINLVASNGVVNGYPDGTFKPEDKITYAEIIKMLVIINGDLPVEDELDSWEVPYIQKALELGILEGITITSYSNQAIRETMFEMVYNLMSKNSAFGLEIYKGIVIGNARVKGLDKNQIAIEVIGRDSSAINYRFDKGNNVFVKLSELERDTEQLLGKVIDVTINERNEALSLTIDNNYSYLRGQTTIKSDELTINGKSYGVIDINRFTNTMDKLVAVFHNDKEYKSFKEYFEKVASTKEFSTDFSNVTMKGNNILFIDSFNFEDIAPVKETLKSGKEVYIYKDDGNGSLVKFTPIRVLRYTETGLRTMEEKDMKANDVVHIYDRDKAIVRADAVKTGTFERYKEGSEHSYIQIGGKDHLVVEVNKRRPVYSLDGTRFFTLFASRGDLDLYTLRGEKVSILLDINNKIQSIIGNSKYDEGVFAMDETTRRSANVIGSNNGSATVVVELNSVLNFLGSNTNKSIEDFHRGDLVYLMKEENRIEKMLRMETVANVSRKAKPVTKTLEGGFELSKFRIRVDETRNLTSNFKIYNANVFIMEVDENKEPKIVGTTLDNIIENTKANSDLKAYIISNKDINIMNMGNTINYGNEADVAHTIIFTNFENTNVNLAREVVEITYKFTPVRDTVIYGKDMNGITIKRNVGQNVDLPAFIPGDIVELGLDKDKTVAEAIIKIPKSDETFKVIEIDRYSSVRARRVVLEDSNKVRNDYYILKDVFNFGEVKAGDVVSVNFNLAGDIDVIVVR